VFVIDSQLFASVNATLRIGRNLVPNLRSSRELALPLGVDGQVVLG